MCDKRGKDEEAIINGVLDYLLEHSLTTRTAWDFVEKA